MRANSSLLSTNYLMVNGYTDHAGFSKPSARSRFFTSRQELQSCDEGGVSVSHSLHPGQVEGCVDINNSLVMRKLYYMKSTGWSTIPQTWSQ